MKAFTIEKERERKNIKELRRLYEKQQEKERRMLRKEHKAKEKQKKLELVIFQICYFLITMIVISIFTTMLIV